MAKKQGLFGKEKIRDCFEFFVKYIGKIYILYRRSK